MNPKQHASTTVSLGGHGVLSTDLSISLLNKLGKSNLLVPMTEAQLINPSGRDLDEEFNLLCKVTNTQEHQDALYINEHTRKHNRYSDIIPYGHTMVSLQTPTPNHPTHGYINANFVKDPYTGEVTEFIATQGPIPETVSNFWRMVWQQAVSSIVMLCGLEENGRVSCHVYWPDSTNHKFTVENLQVEAGDIDKSNDFYWVRQIVMRNIQTKEQRVVSQYHSVGWPDRKIPTPQHWKHLLGLINRLRDERKVSKAPFVVHCSAGIGRTGTLIALYFMVTLLNQQREQGLPLQASIFGTVRSLREQRAGSVQTLEQYKFIHNFLSLYLQKKL